MKIGLVCPYNLFRGGGVQECVIALQSELSYRGHDVKIITPLPREYEGRRPKNVIFIGNAAQVKSFHTTSQISVTVSGEAVDVMLAEEAFDVLHFHEPWVPMVSMQILSRSNSANIATFHAKLPETVMSRTIERVITPYTKSIIKYLDQLTAVSNAAAEYVHSLTTKPVAIIPNGINLTEYSKKTNKATPSKRKRILYIGRLEKRKGIIYLLKAYDDLTKQMPDIELIIAGEGPDRLKLETYVSENNIPRVSFRGYISQAEKVRLLHTSDIFCSPARYGESFGIVLLEAMASGLVVVAGNNSGYSAVLEERGAISLVNPKDTSQFSQRLKLLMQDDGIRELWRIWAKKHVQQFEYAKIVDKYEELYKQAVKDS